MVDLRKNRYLGVASPSIFENACSVGGVKVNVIGEMLYVVHGNEVLHANWCDEQNEYGLIPFFSETQPVIQFLVNQQYFAYSVEGKGVTVVDDLAYAEVGCIPEAQEHFALMGQSLLYNVGRKVYVKELSDRMELPAKCVYEAPCTITQLFVDCQHVVVQLENPNFFEAKKVLLNTLTFAPMEVGVDWYLVDNDPSRLEEKIRLTKEQKLQLQKNVSIMFEGNYVTYTHFADEYVCYQAGERYVVALAHSLDCPLVELTCCKLPAWFVYLGNLVVYEADGYVEYARISLGENLTRNYVMEGESQKPPVFEVGSYFQMEKFCFLTNPFLHVFKFNIIAEDEVEPEQKMSCKQYTEPKHVELLCSQSVSLLTVYEVVKLFEQLYDPDLLEWNVTKVNAVRDNQIVAYVWQLELEKV